MTLTRPFYEENFFPTVGTRERHCYYQVHPKDEMQFIITVERYMDEYVTNQVRPLLFQMTHRREENHIYLRLTGRQYGRLQVYTDLLVIGTITEEGAIGSKETTLFQPDDPEHLSLLYFFSLQHAGVLLSSSFNVTAKYGILKPGDWVTLSEEDSYGPRSRPYVSGQVYVDEHGPYLKEGDAKHRSLVSLLAAAKKKVNIFDFDNVKVQHPDEHGEWEWTSMEPAVIRAILRERSMRDFCALQLRAIGVPIITLKRFKDWADVQYPTWATADRFPSVFAHFVTAVLCEENGHSEDTAQSAMTHHVVFEASQVAKSVWEPCLRFPSLFRLFSPVHLLAYLVREATLQAQDRNIQKIATKQSITLHSRSFRFFDQPNVRDESDIQAWLATKTSALARQPHVYYHAMSAEALEKLRTDGGGLQLRVPPHGGKQDFGFAPSFYVTPSLAYAWDRGLSSALRSPVEPASFVLLMFQMQDPLEGTEDVLDLSGLPRLAQWRHVVTVSRNTHVKDRMEEGGEEEDPVGQHACVVGNGYHAGKSPISPERTIQMDREVDRFIREEGEGAGRSRVREEEESMAFALPTESYHWAEDSTQIAIRSNALMEDVRRSLTHIFRVSSANLGFQEIRKYVSKEIKKDIDEMIKSVEDRFPTLHMA